MIQIDHCQEKPKYSVQNPNFSRISEFQKIVKLQCMEAGWRYPKGHLSIGHTFVSIENLTSDYLTTWSISRGRGAVENALFDPHSGWDTGGGYPRGHLSIVRIFVSIEKLTSD